VQAQGQAPGDQALKDGYDVPVGVQQQGVVVKGPIVDATAQALIYLGQDGGRFSPGKDGLEQMPGAVGTAVGAAP